MLMELNHQIKEGEAVPINLISQDDSGKRVTLSIKAIAALPKTSESSPDAHMHH
jgi:copper(I)-binding protein